MPLALVLHAIVDRDARSSRPTGSTCRFRNALSLVAWLTVLIAWASGLFAHAAAGRLRRAAGGGGGALVHAFGASPHRFRYSGDSPGPPRTSPSRSSRYALFVVAALQALMLTGLERRLRGGIVAAGDETPPLLTLERFLFRLVAAGFVLLTLALASGFLFSEQLFGSRVTFTHKNVFSVAGWLAFAVLLFGRWRYGWRGRTALRWILAGTAAALLGYLGSKFVLEVLLLGRRPN